jgi:urease accessory protein
MAQPESKSVPLISLLQLTDSALPIGAYSHSWGLETFVQNGTINNAREAQEAINNLLRYTLAPREGAAAALAFRFQKSPNRVNNRNSLVTLNQYLSASLWVEETHEASIKMGERLLRLAESLGWVGSEDFSALTYTNTKDGSPQHQPSEQDKYRCHHCVAMGYLGAKLGIALSDLIPAYLFAATTALVAALIKLVPLGHTDGQRILANCQGLIAELSSTCMEATLADIGGFAPVAEWGQAAHQSLYSRLFQS